MKLFLDDVREPSECVAYMHHRIVEIKPIYLEEWVVVRTYKEFCKAIVLHYEQITHISFDHDLADCFQLKESEDIDAWFDVNGNREYTGLDCAKFMKDYYETMGMNRPIMFVHSMNPVGTQKIIQLFI